MNESFSIYKSPEAKANCLSLYETALERWPVPYEQIDLSTRFGSTHIIASGPKNSPPVILLHGQWVTSTMWSSIIAELSRDHRAYAIDQIDDIGKSIPDHAISSRSEYSGWLLEVIDKLEIIPADIVGLSFGGFLATNLALATPDKVKRLCLLCPGVPSFGPPTRKWAFHGLPMTLFPSRVTARWLVDGMSIHGYRDDDPESQRIVAGVINLRSRIPFRPRFNDAEFQSLKMPVCLLLGDRETLYDPDRAIVRARQLIPHIEAILIPNAGHMLTSDQPRLVIDHIVRFLQNSG
jgi:pimeloyl-ACP methyl ester carboxylesterase